MGSQDLFDAAMAGDPRRARWALQAHADPNASSQPVGLRALHLCAALGHVKAAQVLLEYKADVAAAEGALGLSALSTACLAGHREVTQLLICAYAPLDGPEGDGASPLLHAALRNFAEICEVLVSSGADVNLVYRRSEDPTRVQEALARQNPSGQWRQVLYEAETRLSADVLRVEGASPLHLAAAHGNMRVCDIDVLGRTPLLLAGEKGYVQAATLLIQCHANVSPDVEGHTVATLAARAGHVAVAQLLIQRKVVAVDFAPQRGGARMLHVAVHNGQGGCTSMLCERNADVGIPLEPGGIRPLMLAAARGHREICQELLAYAAQVNDADGEGRTAWTQAAAAGRASVCALLAAHGAGECAALQARVGPAGGVGQASATDAQRRRLSQKPPVPILPSKILS